MLPKKEIMESQQSSISDYRKPKATEIDKIFVHAVMDLKQILVLDAIDMRDPGFAVRCHDLHGPLHEIAFKNSGDTFKDKDRYGIEVCKLIAITGLREKIC
jgi:hypothetical protein